MRPGGCPCAAAARGPPCRRPGGAIDRADLHRMTDMTRAPLLAFAVLGLAACSQDGPAGSGEQATVQAAAAICRPTPVGRRMTGCYLSLTAPAADRLLSVTSPDANLVQIHESRIESGMMMMGELRDGLPLPAGETVALKPGGDHLMLMGVKQPLVPGDTVTLALTFASSGPVELTATVGQPEATTSAAAAH